MIAKNPFLFFLKIGLSCGLMGFGGFTAFIEGARAQSQLPSPSASSTQSPLAAPPVTSDSAANFKERLNKIFYWQLSDELKLTPKQEKEMAAALEDMQGRKQKALRERDVALQALNALGPTPSAEQAGAKLGEYQKALLSLSKLDGEEYLQLKKVLGPQNLVHFYVVRERVLEKLRNALTDKDPAKP